MMSASRFAWWMAVRAICAKPARSATLMFAIGLVLGIPVLTHIGIRGLQDTLLDRATATPIIVGTSGASVDLALAGLLFRAPALHSTTWQHVQALSAHDTPAIPILLGPSVRETPLVATSPEYFESRDIRLQEGRLPALLGEVVAGSDAAAANSMQVGDPLRAGVHHMHDLSADPPLTLTVVGILGSSGTPDDHVLFTDMTTGWALQGHLHGHDPAETTSNKTVESSSGASSGAPTEIRRGTTPHDVTPAALSAFHFHSDRDSLPVTAFLLFPSSPSAQDRLLDDISLIPELQAVRPSEVLQTLQLVISTVSNHVLTLQGLLAVAALSLLLTCIDLARRLRAPERQLLRQLGASSTTLLWITVWEGIVLLLGGSSIATVVAFTGHALLSSGRPL